MSPTLAISGLNLAGQLVARANSTDTSTGKHAFLTYTPSNALTAICCIAYLLLALVLSFNMWRHGGRYMLAMVIGCYVYAGGVALRFPLRTNMTSLPIYIAENALVTLAPCGFIATEYMLLGRLAAWLRGTRHLLIPANRITLVFMSSDIITFLIQAAGVNFVTSSTANTAKLGGELLKAGMVIQFISFCVFIALLLSFMFKMYRNEQYTWYRDRSAGWKDDWRSFGYAICVSCIGIFIRSVYRVVEMVAGSSSKLQTTEAYFYALDALPLLFALSVYIPFWPGRFIPAGIDLKAIPFDDAIAPQASQVHLNRLDR